MMSISNVSVREIGYQLARGALDAIIGRAFWMVVGMIVIATLAGRFANRRHR